MANASAELSNEDFFHSHLAEYLDGELPAAHKARFEEQLKAGSNGQVPEHYQAMRGRLQLALQSYYLKETETQALRALVQDPSVKATQENIKIDQLDRGEMIGTWVRRAVLGGLALALVGALAWHFMPSSGPKFKPLEYLGYEALAMEEDAQGRLDLPTGDMKEVRQYLGSYPGLDFKPRTLKQIAERWKPEGASIIDYDIAKVAVVQYVSSDTKEKLFHFSFAGELEDLPAAPGNTMNGIKFQTYASEQMNLVGWQHGAGVVSLLVGRRSAAELYEMAVNGSKQ